MTLLWKFHHRFLENYDLTVQNTEGTEKNSELCRRG